MVAVLILAPSIGVRAWPTVALLAAGAVLTHTPISMTAVLACDLVLALSLWWLFGPVSGANFIPYVVVSLGPLLLPSVRARLLLAAASLAVAAQAALHVLSGRVVLPFFHQSDPIPQGEFFAGLAIQAILLVAVGALMLYIADSLHAGRRALAADLERQRELHRLKDSFLATASHQLRTPLTALRGFSQLLLERDLPDAERAEYLGLVVSQTEEMHTLVEDLITFNRIEAGEFSVRLESVHPASVVETTVRGMGPTAADVAIDVDTDIVVQADPLRLAQMIRNLVDNALRYGEAPVSVVGSRDGEWFRCVVSDAGPGLSERDAAKAFDPYVRLVSNETMSEPGLGLGLTVVRELVNRHGGTVRYLGPAAGFELRIPMTEASSVAPQLPNSVVSG
ncbi:MAG: HAMP domain-containing sensor histidine kinase [Acidimicrobiia bacterium]